MKNIYNILNCKFYVESVNLSKQKVEHLFFTYNSVRLIV